MKTVYIASDHAGIDLKSELIRGISDVKWIDLGPQNKDSVDYPDFADLVCKNILTNTNTLGILICGSGQGMSIRANKYPQIRAALCWNEEIAQLSRAHNDANVLCMGARFIQPDLAKKITQNFLNTHFEGGRHSQRVAKLEKATNT